MGKFIAGCLARITCWFLKHDMVSEGNFDNGQSQYGAYRCLRCGRNHTWQYDR